MKSVICPIVLTFFSFGNNFWHLCLVFVTLIINFTTVVFVIISFYFFVIISTVVFITNSSIIAFINVFVIKNFTLPSSLPLLLIFLFFLLLLKLLYFFVIFYYSQCCYSYQVNIIIIIAFFVNFLIYTFDFHLWVSVSQIFFELTILFRA